MRTLVLAAILTLAVVPAAVAKAPCRDPHNKLVDCPPPARSLRHPICVDSKPCGAQCIPRYKICHE